MGWWAYAHQMMRHGQDAAEALRLYCYILYVNCVFRVTLTRILGRLVRKRGIRPGGPNCPA